MGVPSYAQPRIGEWDNVVASVYVPEEEMLSDSCLLSSIGLL